MTTKKTKPSLPKKPETAAGPVAVAKDAVSITAKMSMEPVEAIPRTPAFPIVGIGASAGGLEAFEQFFRSMPIDSGLGFVLVPHLDPSHASILSEILQRSTVMPVVEALDQMVVTPNTVHIIPPNRDLSIFHGILQLSVPEKPRGLRMPIDAFMRSLADDQGENAIGIILSGTGTDGTLGLRAIHGAGGVTLVQEPSTAKYDGMPVSALQAGYATQALELAKMPEVLMNVLRRQMKIPGRANLSKPGSALPPLPVGGMNRILLQLRNSTGHDFALYKKSTLTRRIQRRMLQLNIDDIDVYARQLKESLSEAQLLFKEMLINVTSFFRDPEAFEVLKREILPLLLQDKPEVYTFRIWVAGCASGEEAYSIAILLREVLDEARKDFRIQLYATDLDEDAIGLARQGFYPPNIVADVTTDRLRRYFIKEELGYRVKKEIREMVVFAVQNIIKDPPFTKLDMLSCRNLMIYLEPELQNRLIPMFRYALKQGGVLFLSPSESIGNHTDIFSAENRKWKFYRAASARTSTVPRMNGELSWTQTAEIKEPQDIQKIVKAIDFADMATRALLQSFAPASVLVDNKGNLLYVHGETKKYLRPPPGQATLKVIDMAHEGLQIELRSAMQAALQSHVVIPRLVIIPTENGPLTVKLSVRTLPSTEAGQELLLVSFTEVDMPAPENLIPAGRRRKSSANPSTEKQRIEELERALGYTRENLQATIEEQQASNEELKSTNEELQSTNEELQSTNEELETSREELQSVNEELITVNTELQSKIEQLAGMQNDMKNLLDNIHIATVFLDQNLNIRSFTGEATEIYRLVATDVGRPLADIKSDLSEELTKPAQSVLKTLVPWQLELSTPGAWFLVRIQPYRTLDNVIDGVVLTFTNITEQRSTNERIKRNESMLLTAQRIAGLGCWELDLATDQVSWSPEMYVIFDQPTDSTPMSLTKFLDELLYPDDRELVNTAIQELIDQGTPYNISYRISVSGGSTRYIRARGKAVTGYDGKISHLVGIVQDVTQNEE